MGFTAASIALLMPPLLAGVGDDNVLQSLYFLEAETGPNKELTRFTYSGNSWAWGARHDEVLGDPNGAGTFDRRIVDMSRVTYVMFTGGLLAEFVVLGLSMWDVTMVRLGYKNLGILYTYTLAILATTVGLATYVYSPFSFIFIPPLIPQYQDHLLTRHPAQPSSWPATTFWPKIMRPTSVSRPLP